MSRPMLSIMPTKHQPLFLFAATPSLCAAENHGVVGCASGGSGLRIFSCERE